jgi:hypothetical protein
MRVRSIPTAVEGVFIRIQKYQTVAPAIYFGGYFSTVLLTERGSQVSGVGAGAPYISAYYVVHRPEDEST